MKLFTLLGDFDCRGSAKSGPWNTGGDRENPPLISYFDGNVTSYGRFFAKKNIAVVIPSVQGHQIRGESPIPRLTDLYCPCPHNSGKGPKFFHRRVLFKNHSYNFEFLCINCKLSYEYSKILAKHSKFSIELQ